VRQFSCWNPAKVLTGRRVEHILVMALDREKQIVLSLYRSIKKERFSLSGTSILRIVSPKSIPHCIYTRIAAQEIRSNVSF
jgi:hypothetical protein